MSQIEILEKIKANPGMTQASISKEYYESTGSNSTGYQSRAIRQLLKKREIIRIRYKGTYKLYEAKNDN